MSRIATVIIALLVFAVSIGNISIPALAGSYRLKAGDTLDINVWQDQKLNRQVVVAPDGYISVPLAGELRAGGRTAASVENELEGLLQKQYVDKIDVTVSVAAIKEIPPLPEPPPAPPPPPPIDPSFFATGEVKKPGQFFFKTRTSLIQAIAIAGGLGPFAAEHRIKLRRNVNGVETLYDFDYDAFTSGVDLSGNMLIHSGDVIIVPEKGIFE
jgi:polysaccharide biosynthesis/export protein